MHHHPGHPGSMFSCPIPVFHKKVAKSNVYHHHLKPMMIHIHHVYHYRQDVLHNQTILWTRMSPYIVLT